MIDMERENKRRGVKSATNTGVGPKRSIYAWLPSASKAELFCFISLSQTKFTLTVRRATLAHAAAPSSVVVVIIIISCSSSNRSSRNFCCHSHVRDNAKRPKTALLQSHAETESVWDG